MIKVEPCGINAESAPLTQESLGLKIFLCFVVMPTRCLAMEPVYCMDLLLKL